MATKFGMGDEVGDHYPCAKFYHYPITGFCSPPPPPPPARSGAYEVTRLVNFWGFFFFFSRAKTPASIFTISTSNDVVLRKDVPFGVPKTKFYISSPICPQNANFWPILDGTKFRVKKTLTLAMLTCKLPLILIIAS